jgi:hypothetical protein
MNNQPWRPRQYRYYKGSLRRGQDHSARERANATASMTNVLDLRTR